MALPFSSGQPMIDYLILRLGNYPQHRGTRPLAKHLHFLRRGGVHQLLTSVPVIRHRDKEREIVHRSTRSEALHVVIKETGEPKLLLG
jgi:hypothetical protein